MGEGVGVSSFFFFFLTYGCKQLVCFLHLNKSFIANRAASVMFVFEDETLVSTHWAQQSSQRKNTVAVKHVKYLQCHIALHVYIIDPSGFWVSCFGAAAVLM